VPCPLMLQRELEATIVSVPCKAHLTTMERST
jgi:hypothetical protein